MRVKEILGEGWRVIIDNMLKGKNLEGYGETFQKDKSEGMGFALLKEKSNPNYFRRGPVKGLAYGASHCCCIYCKNYLPYATISVN